MSIEIDRDIDFNPAIKQIMNKLKELEEKIDLIKSDIELQLKEKKKVK